MALNYIREDRKETVKHSVEERQQTRDGHIKERKQQKKERKIAKVSSFTFSALSLNAGVIFTFEMVILKLNTFFSQREKKLLRPGFEGRRGGFLNE